MIFNKATKPSVNELIAKSQPKPEIVADPKYAIRQAYMQSLMAKPTMSTTGTTQGALEQIPKMQEAISQGNVGNVVGSGVTGLLNFLGSSGGLNTIANSQGDMWGKRAFLDIGKEKEQTESAIQSAYYDALAKQREAQGQYIGKEDERAFTASESGKTRQFQKEQTEAQRKFDAVQNQLNRNVQYTQLSQAEKLAVQNNIKELSKDKNMSLEDQLSIMSDPKSLQLLKTSDTGPIRDLLRMKRYSKLERPQESGETPMPQRKNPSQGQW